MKVQGVGHFGKHAGVVFGVQVRHQKGFLGNPLVFHINTPGTLKESCRSRPAFNSHNARRMDEGSDVGGRLWVLDSLQ